MAILVNIDNGGTFTDVCISDGDRVVHAKSPTTPHDLTQCFLEVLKRGSRELYGEEDAARLIREADCLRYSTTSGTNAVVDLLAHSRQRYITGAIPSREQEAKYWRGVFALGDGPAGTEAWASRIAKGDPLELAAIIRENDAYAYRAAAERFAQGWSWTGKEPAPIAAMGLRARCESADLWEAALRTDRLWRHRAVHTGHVTGGTVTSATRSTFTVACPRMGSRLRAGSDIVGWIGGVDSADRAVIFHGEIQSAEAHAGELHLTVARVQAANRPSIGHWVTLMPAPPNDRIVRMSRSRYRRLLFQGDSWIAAGKPPGVRRRDVPLDVLVAAAETD